MTEAEKKIMVVEDNEDSRKLVVKVLSRAGYKVLEADSGEEAIRLSALERPHLILMDVGLAGMDGLTATSIIKANVVTKDIPVVALTAYALEDDRARVLKAGCDGYISKPVNVRILPQEVEKFMRGE